MTGNCDAVAVVLMAVFGRLPGLNRAFPVAAAKVWNSLPTAITSLPTVHSFRRALKTELFVRSFGSARHRP